jgi:hypothetical protein
MNPHSNLRAYMAGVLLPTWFLLIALAGFVAGRLVFQIPVPIERIIVFPMAVVPNLWGLWNLLYIAMVLKHRITLGLWGALLPLILVPSGLLLEQFMETAPITPLGALAVLPVAVAIYYLAWKHIVGFFNHAVGLE